MMGRLAAPFTGASEVGARRLLYEDPDPETGCRIYTRDPEQVAEAGAADEDALYA